MKCLLSCVSLVLFLGLAGPANAQEPLLERLKQVETNNAALAQRLGGVETKIDALAVKVDQLARPARTYGVCGPDIACPAGGCQTQGQCGYTGCECRPAGLTAGYAPAYSFEAADGAAGPQRRLGLFRRLRGRCR